MHQGFKALAIGMTSPKGPSLRPTPIRIGFCFRWLLLATIGVCLVLQPASAPATEPPKLQVTLAWDPNRESDLQSYVVHYGLRPRDYFHHEPVGLVTTAVIQLPLPSVTYYLAVTARDTEGLQSDYSMEVIFEAPPGEPIFESVQRANQHPEDQVLILDFGEHAWNPSAEWTATLPPSHGTIALVDSGLAYIPQPNTWGKDRFEIVGNLGTTKPLKWVWEVDVLPANDPPIALDRAVSTEAAVPVEIQLVAEDFDGDPLAYEIVSYPTQGTLSGRPPQVVYTPRSDARGFDSFTFRATDGAAFSAMATVTVELLPVSSPLLIQDQLFEVTEDRSFTFQISLLDRPDLFIRILKQPDFGLLSGAPPILTYSPASNYFGVDYMSVEVLDPTGLKNSAIIYFDIIPVNDPPVSRSSAVGAPAGGVIELPLFADDVDPDELLFEIVEGPTKGTLWGDAWSVFYRPNPGETGTDSIMFRAFDGYDFSDPAVIDISISTTATPIKVQALLDPAGNVILRWNSTPGQRFQVLYREQWSDLEWIPAGDPIVATSITARWNGPALPGKTATFYAVELLSP
jgi:hypothetical protein